MTDIQHARHVLAKWRDGATPGPWQVNRPTPEIIGQRADYVGDIESLADLRLIVGTAGNPALWDAIDGMLLDAVRHGQYAESDRMAAAIIAADERMSA